MSTMEREALVIAPGATARAAPLAHVLRGGRVESVHRGHVAVVDDRGRLLAWAGEPRSMVFPRSAFKPFQALPLVESGAFARSGLGADALALIAGSHSGTDRHEALARTILEAAGADESALRCGSHPPYDDATAEARRIDASDPDRPRALIAVASAYLIIDRPKAWDALFDAAKGANSAETFTGEDGVIRVSLITKGTSSIRSSSTRDFDIAPIFGELAHDDYNRAVELKVLQAVARRLIQVSGDPTLA